MFVGRCKLSPCEVALAIRYDVTFGFFEKPELLYLDRGRDRIDTV